LYDGNIERLDFYCKFVNKNCQFEVKNKINRGNYNFYHVVKCLQITDNKLEKNFTKKIHNLISIHNITNIFRSNDSIKKNVYNRFCLETLDKTFLSLFFNSKNEFFKKIQMDNEKYWPLNKKNVDLFLFDFKSKYLHKNLKIELDVRTNYKSWNNVVIIRNLENNWKSSNIKV